MVDDDRSLCESVAMAMGNRGFVVTWRLSAVEALALLCEEDFDVVVTDPHMRGEEGLAFCQRVIAIRPDVPIVVMTAFGSLESTIIAMHTGVYDFITKPFDLEMLRLTLARAVQHRMLGDDTFPLH